MPKLASLLSERGRVEIAVPDDEPLIVEYRRGIMTPRMQAKMAAMQAATDAESAQEALVFFCDLYSRMILSWNLTDTDGTVIGTDAESLKDVEIDVLALVAREIGRQLAPDPLSGGGSNNGSSPKDDSESLRSITAS